MLPGPHTNLWVGVDSDLCWGERGREGVSSLIRIPSKSFQTSLDGETKRGHTSHTGPLR